MPGAEPAGRSDNGQRQGIRFRRGSRAPLRGGEVPLIGVVQMDAPAEPVGAVAMLEEPAVESEPARRKPARPARAAKEGCGGGRNRSGFTQGRRRRGTCGTPREANASAGQEEGGVSGTGRAATLPVSFFTRPADEVARELLGATVVSTLGGARTAGRIVEVEAYLGYDDPASHGYRNRRHAQNEALFGPAGTWYVYLSYGMHWCANLVCGAPGHGSAVLLRALEPVQGLATMRERRGVQADRQLCSGPGKLCQALGITRDQDGLLMRRSGARVVSAGERPAVVVTPRIGITKAADWPLRFVVDGSPWVSRAPSPST